MKTIYFVEILTFITVILIVTSQDFTKVYRSVLHNTSQLRTTQHYSEHQ